MPKTPHVRTWAPEGLSATAPLVLYCHGYYVNLDQAWEKHHLARQFAASGSTARFVAVDTPSSSSERVSYADLEKLLDALDKQLRLPTGPVVVIGHSGAYRTLVHWLKYPWLDHLILLDACYGGIAQFETWGKDLAHAMTLVGASAKPKKNAKAIAKKLDAVMRADVPTSFEGFSDDERAARVLYLDSQYDHFGIVTSEKVIPTLVRRALPVVH